MEEGRGDARSTGHTQLYARRTAGRAGRPPETGMSGESVWTPPMPAGIREYEETGCHGLHVHAGRPPPTGDVFEARDDTHIHTHTHTHTHTQIMLTGSPRQTHTHTL